MYPKLVRDKIPDIITSDDKTVVYRKLVNDDEYIEQLNNKLLEEVNEYIESKDKDNIKEELADILEVVYSICKQYGISEMDLNDYRKYKSNIKGSFSKRIYIEEVK